MATTAGARRGATALDRLVEGTLPADVIVLPNQPGFDWEAVRSMPQVAALTGFVVGGGALEGLPGAEHSLGFPPADAELFDTVERPVVLAGRLPDPHRADEVVTSASFERVSGRGVGDTVTIRLYSPEQLADLTQSEDAPEGRRVDATIVGVIRSPWFAESPDMGPGVQPSPGLFEQYPDEVLDPSVGYVNAMVRLHGGEAAVESFTADLAALTGRRDIDIWNQHDAGDHVREVVGFQSNSLLAFALAAVLAALVLIGQAIARSAAGAAVDLETMRAMGMTGRQSRIASALGPTLAATVGVVVGAAAAVVASRWFPIGSAAPYEPAPGVDVDMLVLGLGLVVVPILVGAGAMAAAAVAMRPFRRPARRSVIASAAARVGAPPSVAIGWQFAFERGRGRESVPVRLAFTGAIVGVLGTIAALTFSDGVQGAVDDLDRFGQTYELEAFIGLNGEDFGPADEVMTSFVADPEVESVNDSRVVPVEAEGQAFEVFSLDHEGRRDPEVVLTDGRAPDSDAEIALAPRTAQAAGASVGDTIEVRGDGPPRSMLVSGLAFVPTGPHNDYASGAWVTGAGFDHLSPDGFKFHVIHVWLRDGVDVHAAAERLGEPFDGGVELPEPPPEVTELRQVRAFPLLLAAFLALLALTAVGHALATAVRRRGHDLAALRALGMTRPQARAVVWTQATILAVAGLVVGLPIGFLLGQRLWQEVADNTPVLYRPPVAVLAFVVIVPAALVLANLLGALPARRAARMHLGRTLRAG